MCRLPVEQASKMYNGKTWTKAILRQAHILIKILTLPGPDSSKAHDSKQFQLVQKQYHSDRWIELAHAHMGLE